MSHEWVSVVSEHEPARKCWFCQRQATGYLSYDDAFGCCGFNVCSNIRHWNRFRFVRWLEASIGRTDRYENHVSMFLSA